MTTCITTPRRARRVRLLGPSPANIRAASVEAKRAADTTKLRHPGSERGGARRPRRLDDRRPREPRRLGFVADLLRDLHNGVAIHDEHCARVRRDRDSHLAEATRHEQLRDAAVAAKDAKMAAWHAYQASFQRQEAALFEQSIPGSDEQRQHAVARLHAIAIRFAPRAAHTCETVCVRLPPRKPRQRRSHRAVAKTAGGDSGDPDPEASRHTAAIGGVL